MACEIEIQTVRWIAEFIGYPSTCGGVLVSGGNMANFVGFWVGRRKKLPWDVRTLGIGSSQGRPRVYTSEETHTWIQKAVDLSGLGTESIRLISTDDRLRLDVGALRKQIEADRAAGDIPFMVVSTAGSVSTGAIDPTRAISDLCREHDLWLHLDGAYGAPVAALPDAHPDLKALELADSIAVDPHKWLYAPVEAGCTLVKSYDLLRDTFAYRPPYYPEKDTTSAEPPLMNHEIGPQNSKGFRGLKVWLAMRQVGREGYVRMISEDIELARAFHDLAAAHEELETFLYGLSVSTFRYVPRGLETGSKETDGYLDDLNRAILDRVQKGGEAFISNAVIRGRFVLRMCVVNFRTTLKDIEALPEIVARVGRELDSEMRPLHSRSES
jgi:glutamate/tyrosine decarboxylase-like PLP-dependent enzyme